VNSPVADAGQNQILAQLKFQAEVQRDKMPVPQRKATPTRAPAAYVPGSLVIDEANEKLSVDFVRHLRESGPLPERERWLPTRWLMMAVWEAVHCEGAAMSSLRKGFRSAQDNDALVVEIYRKMTCDNASASEEALATQPPPTHLCCR